MVLMLSPVLLSVKLPEDGGSSIFGSRLVHIGKEMVSNSIENLFI